MTVEEFDELRRHVDERNRLYQQSLTQQTHMNERKPTRRERLRMRAYQLVNKITRI